MKRLCSRLSSVAIGVLMVSASVHGLAAAKEAVEGEIGSMGDAVHLEFRGRSSWNYDLKTANEEGRTKVLLRVPATDSATVNRLESWSGPLVNDIAVNRSGPDGTYEITFELDHNVDVFDYLTDDPSRLVVDFYRPNPRPQGRAPAAQETPAAPAEKKSESGKPTVSKKLKVKRAPAGTDYITVDQGGAGAAAQENKSEEKDEELGPQFRHGIFDGADPNIERFRIKDEEIKPEAIRASLKNIYLRFPPLELGLPYLRVLWANPPVYEVKPEENEENKIARLLLVLFEEKKVAMFTKTLDFFRQKHPQSKYNEIVGYIEADLHYHRWRTDAALDEFESAMVRYRQLVERYPASPLAERTYMLMGYSYLERNDSLGALKILNRFLSVKPETKYRDKARLAIAESYLRLNRFDEAIDTYRELSRKADHARTSVEADYLAGDVFLKKGDFRAAIAAYQSAMNKHSAIWQEYPNAQFNMAEGHFWTGNYKESMNQYIEFLRKFPSHPFGGYAMTRLGEILEIFGAPKEKVMGAFLESQFRYRTTEGGALARVRTLTGSMTKMRPNELDEAMKELDRIVADSKLEKTDQFVKMRVSDGYYDRGDFDKATEVLVKYYQQNPTRTNLDVFQTRIVRNITAKIKNKVENGLFLEALQEQNRHKDSWLRKTNRLDIGYYVGQAYEQAGVFKEAEKLYRATLNRLYAIKGTPAETMRGTFEDLPASDSLNLRLAAVSIKDGHAGAANDFLREIRMPDRLTQPEQIELVEIAAQISEARGQLQTALNFLKKVCENWKGRPEMVSGPYAKLAELQFRSKKYSDALASVKKVLNLAADTGKVKAEHQFTALELQAKIHLQRGQETKAVSAYKTILDRFSEDRDLSSMRYKAGKILFDNGDVNGAKEIWSPLKDKENLWSNLASEQTTEVEWRDKYKKYIDRIPAMERDPAQERVE